MSSQTLIFQCNPNCRIIFINQLFQVGGVKFVKLLHILIHSSPYVLTYLKLQMDYNTLDNIYLTKNITSMTDYLNIYSQVEQKLRETESLLLILYENDVKSLNVNLISTIWIQPLGNNNKLKGQDFRINLN